MICNICNKEIDESQYDTDGEHDFHAQCWENEQIQGALLAGIPMSVIQGKTKLTDHFSENYINYKCNREDKHEISN